MDWQIRCAASSANPCFPHYGGDGMLCPRTEDSRTYFGVSLSASCRKELPHSVPRSFSVRDRILDWRDGGVPRGGEGKGCRAGTTVSKVAAIARRGAGGGPVVLDPGRGRPAEETRLRAVRCLTCGILPKGVTPRSLGVLGALRPGTRLVGWRRPSWRRGESGDLARQLGESGRSCS